MRATFITGNAKKAEYLEKLLGVEIDHHKVDVEEIQSLDPREVIEHKVRAAYEILKRPVLVDDVSVDFIAFGRLPGTFIRHFLDELGLEKICRLLDPFDDRSVVARGTMAYYDGENVKIFQSQLAGTVPEHPRGPEDFGFDPIFIPDGYTETRAEMNEADDHKTYLQIKPIKEVASFLKSL